MSRVGRTEVAALPLTSPSMRIGLLGGSFNPAHEAHRQISLIALKRLGLDRVWWLVSPSNPLKDTAKLPGLAQRIAEARKIADHPRIDVTGYSSANKSPYTVDLLTNLQRRFPNVNFVWLMGADNLAGFHRWHEWPRVFTLMPIAVLDRPGYRLKARASQAAMRFSDYYVDESDASGLILQLPPAWTVLSHPLSTLSSTELRKTKSKPKSRDKPPKKSQNAARY